MSSSVPLTRLGALAALVGAPLLFVSTLLHPLEADPNDPVAAFAEAAASETWIVSHLGQFLGVALIGIALVALSYDLRDRRAVTWGTVGRMGTFVTVAMAAALQAVDGIALKMMADRWVSATPSDKAAIFEATFAVRQVEVGLASLFSLVFGLTATVFGVTLLSDEHPKWLGWMAILGGAGVGAAVAQAFTGFSNLAMNMSMPASVVLLVWIVAVGLRMLRQEAA